MMERWVGEDGKPLFKGYDNFKVVKSLEENDWHYLDGAGWHLLAILDGQQEIVTELREARDSRSGLHAYNVVLHSEHVLTKAHFLFGRLTEGVVADLKEHLQKEHDKNNDLRGETWRLEQALTGEKETSADLLNAKDALEKRVEALEESKRSQAADFAQRNKDYAKLLDDLMKLRRHFGEAAVQKVLGEES